MTWSTMALTWWSWEAILMDLDTHLPFTNCQWRMASSSGRRWCQNSRFQEVTLWPWPYLLFNLHLHLLPPRTQLLITYQTYRHQSLAAPRGTNEKCLISINPTFWPVNVVVEAQWDYSLREVERSRRVSEKFRKIPKNSEKFRNFFQKNPPPKNCLPPLKIFWPPPNFFPKSIYPPLEKLTPF